MPDTINIGTSTGTSYNYTWGEVLDTFRRYNNTERWPISYDRAYGWNGICHIEDCNTVISSAKEESMKQTAENKTPKIKKVIFSDPATIVLWEDGTKTVVKTQKGDAYDPEKGLAMACMRKILSKKDYHHWLEEARGKNTPINEEVRSKGV